MAKNKSDFVILLDIDDILDDLLPYWLEVIDKRYHTGIKFEDVKFWEMDRIFPGLTKEQIFDPLTEDDFWENVKPIEGSQEYLKKLLDEGFTIKLCSSSSPKSWYLKYTQFIKKYFPYISWKNVFIAHDKQMVKGNVLFDDNINNLIGGEYVGVLLDKPHNRHYDEKSMNIMRVYNWEQFYNFIQAYYFIWSILRENEN